MRRWSMNNTTYNNLFDVFGKVTSKWVGKGINLKMEHFNFRDKDVTGIVGEPAM